MLNAGSCDFFMTQQQPISENRPSLLDADYVSAWLSLHMKNIFYGLCAGVILLIATYFLAYRDTKLSEREYIKAANDFAAFTRTPTGDSAAQTEAFKSLQAIMLKHADLQAAYGGSVAQTLINRGDISDALPLAQQTLKRTAANHLAFYEEYSQTTLLILQEQFKEALAKAQNLQSLMDNEVKTIPSWENRSFGPELFPLNLLRIALLQQMLGDTAGEKAIWKLWSQYAGITAAEKDSLSVDPRPFHLIIQQLAIGTTSLPDYIKERTK